MTAAPLWSEADKALFAELLIDIQRLLMRCGRSPLPEGFEAGEFFAAAGDFHMREGGERILLFESCGLLGAALARPLLYDPDGIRRHIRASIEDLGVDLLWPMEIFLGCAAPYGEAHPWMTFRPFAAPEGHEALFAAFEAAGDLRRGPEGLIWTRRMREVLALGGEFDYRNADENAEALLAERTHIERIWSRMPQSARDFFRAEAGRRVDETNRLLCAHWFLDDWRDPPPPPGRAGTELRDEIASLRSAMETRSSRLWGLANQGETYWDSDG